MELAQRGKQDLDFEWKVSRTYLGKVLREAQTYIDHPFKLDWEWLEVRLQ